MINGRCILPIVADVIATVADGIATFVGMFNCDRCYYHCGRWKATFLECLTVADFITNVAVEIATGSMYNCYFYFKFCDVV